MKTILYLFIVVFTAMSCSKSDDYEDLTPPNTGSDYIEEPVNPNNPYDINSDPYKGYNYKVGDKVNLKYLSKDDILGDHVIVNGYYFESNSNINISRLSDESDDYVNIKNGLLYTLDFKISIEDDPREGHPRQLKIKYRLSDRYSKRLELLSNKYDVEFVKLTVDPGKIILISDNHVWVSDKPSGKYEFNKLTETKWIYGNNVKNIVTSYDMFDYARNPIIINKISDAIPTGSGNAFVLRITSELVYKLTDKTTGESFTIEETSVDKYVSDSRFY